MWSKELAELASDYINQDIIIKTAQKINGIWACASLLHVPIDELTGVFQRLENSLKLNGAIYCPF